MKHWYELLEATDIFGLEAIQDFKHKLFSATTERVKEMREYLMKETLLELEHFKNLPCQHTIIKSIEPKKEVHKKLSKFDDSLKLQQSQGSTACSCKSISDKLDDCSVSSSSDSNQVDLDDLMDDIPILICDPVKKKEAKGTKMIPTLDFDIEFD